MFKSIKEKLITIKNNPENQTHVMIANYLLKCIEEKTVPKINECSKVSYCSESVITTFAKKYGYDGFKEISIRIKIETEYYDYNNSKKNANSDNYRNTINKSLNMIDNQDDMINKFINIIKSAKNIYVISCYQQLFNAELFVSELSLYGFRANINIQRKLNQAWINRANEDDIFIFFGFGLDNQYVINYYNLVIKKNIKALVICSKSQKHKFNESNNIIIVDYYERKLILESIRCILIMYLLSKIIKGLI
ncbi:hypothetical protein [Spiroplasma turonicum]|uniref:HTH rpiR-type domain-containing protein n=1 Tax=Spiroplasma turonicum TaxID=216946 RepID=A0A0K1P6T6_9MOLU|nr:hypothetical protein [Spiroplasma turonicum]AKU79934.1 hypothetical protein STURON_00688 [Spiroplasma turonicum]ALX70947.1 hypothetical protein STURO_v1c06880 [Spiroplasma turonicum]